MKSLSQLLSDWRQGADKFQKLRNDLPRIIGNEAKRIVKENFKLQGFDTGHGIEKWAPRKESTNRSYKYGRGKGGKSNYKGSVFNADSPILEQTMNLYNSIQYKAEKDKVFIGVNLTVVPYAQIHNEGLPGKAWGHPFVMTQRKFIPLDKDPANIKILKAIGSKITYERDRVMRNFKL